MKINLITVGKIKENYLKDAIAEYAKRLSRFAKLNIIEVPDLKIKDGASEKEEEMVILGEGELIEKHINKSSYVIALCIEGKKQSSEAFAETIKDAAIKGGSDITFIIGGSLGLADFIKKRADFLLSFSDMTFPHQLMRVILLEQIYRAYKINANEVYHK